MYLQLNFVNTTASSFLEYTSIVIMNLTVGTE